MQGPSSLEYNKHSFGLNRRQANRSDGTCTPCSPSPFALVLLHCHFFLQENSAEVLGYLLLWRLSSWHRQQQSSPHGGCSEPCSLREGFPREETDGEVFQWPAYPRPPQREAAAQRILAAVSGYEAVEQRHGDRGELCISWFRIWWPDVAAVQYSTSVQTGEPLQELPPPAQGHCWGQGGFQDHCQLSDLYQLRNQWFLTLLPFVEEEADGHWWLPRYCSTDGTGLCQGKNRHFLFLSCLYWILQLHFKN